MKTKKRNMKSTTNNKPDAKKRVRTEEQKKARRLRDQARRFREKMRVNALRANEEAKKAAEREYDERMDRIRAENEKKNPNGALKSVAKHNLIGISAVMKKMVDDVSVATKSFAENEISAEKFSSVVSENFSSIVNCLAFISHWANKFELGK